MNSVFALLLALLTAFLGYKFYAGWVDRKVIRPRADRATPATMYMDGVDFIPTSKNVLFGYQFKSIAGAAPVVGAILASQWGWLPALLWLLLGVFFIGWIHDYGSAMVSVREEGQSLGALSALASSCWCSSTSTCVSSLEHSAPSSPGCSPRSPLPRSGSSS